MKVAASPRIYMGQCPKVVFKSPVTSHQSLVTSPLVTEMPPFGIATIYTPRRF